MSPQHVSRSGIVFCLVVCCVQCVVYAVYCMHVRVSRCVSVCHGVTVCAQMCVPLCVCVLVCVQIWTCVPLVCAPVTVCGKLYVPERPWVSSCCQCAHVWVKRLLPGVADCLPVCLPSTMVTVSDAPMSVARRAGSGCEFASRLVDGV